MPSQVLLTQVSATDAFARLLRAHATATRRLNALLVAEHDLTLSDYEVLLRLARAEHGRMRRVDLAQQVLLTASGITRLLDGLETAGYVERGSCDSDRRVVYAVLTDAGAKKLRAASESHVAQIEELFGERLTVEEQAELAVLLEKLGEGDTGACAPEA